MIIGEKELNAEFAKLSEYEMKDAISDAISFVQEAAKGECPKVYGDLRESIATDVERKGDYVVGTCYTNKEYGIYVEFGTGPKGQENHAGISPDVAVAYTQSPWWIPEGSQNGEIDREIADMYHMPRYTHKLDGYLEYEKTFRYTEGQPAHPFMYPALADHVDDVLDIIRKDVKKKL
ncbi:HK97-gp10 family putative phage morphogenesis protein [Hespellia stercorisuis]|uniref:Phage protein, HK97 gp10 family n=1 Tax=Hespellia stercorisuis DSM 15480 TaxID=1121950 RepID=A0A1M6RMJ1_9FIRM|nr:HK97-gp10 family putative phage morphogenesis protein [Hespellia stercorisuis]SHK33672.1 phage protein, HK97 gp10 family [Hespellia stercorisuis DSM 15480]